MNVEYPLATSTWGTEEISALNSVINGGQFTMGSNVKKFENDFAEFFKCKHAVMVNSGSSANLLMLQALKYCGYLQSQQIEIIVPAVSWSTTFYPINQAGFKIVFVDIDVNTFNIDINKVSEAINEKTAAVLAVNLLGAPCDLTELLRICSEKNIILLEDNCESIGSSIDNKFTGTFGLMGTFSTFFSHHICTMEGGLITTNDSKIYEILLSMRAHGWTRELSPDNRLYSKSGNDWQDLFTFILPGFNVRPLEMSGAVGIEQLKKLDSFISFRRLNADYLIKKLSEHKLPVKLQKSDFNSSWFGFGFVFTNIETEVRSEFIKILSQNKIASRPIVAGNFTRNPVIKFLNYDIHENLTSSDVIHENGFFIGNHHYNLEKEIDFFVEILVDYSRKL
jgi:CDP-6-deoxy-D-xylo-4-hexulose-3-dehydrase